MPDSLADKILSNEAEVAIDGKKASVTVTTTNEYDKDVVTQDIANLTSKIAELTGYNDQTKVDIVNREKQIKQLESFREDLRAVLKSFGD